LSAREYRVALGGIILLYALLATHYNLTVPLFETPDEPWHFAYVQHLARGGGLPVQSSVTPGLWRQEGSQPPLYYLAAALLIAPLDSNDFPAGWPANPHAAIGLPLAEGNKNFVIHNPTVEHTPGGTTLAMHLVRGLSTLLGAFTLLAVFRLGRAVFGQPVLPSLLSVALVACNPQFLFIHAAVSNDPMATVTASWSLVAIVERWQQQAQPRPTRMALLLGLAALSKVSNLGLMAILGLAAIWEWGQQQPKPFSWSAWRQVLWQPSIRSSLRVLVIALAIIFPWYLRNLLLYGDLLGLGTMLAIVQGNSSSLADFLRHNEGLELSFWGVFGWFNILAPHQFYTVIKALDRVALAGLLLLLWRSRGRPGLPLTLLAAWLGVMLLALARWATLTPAAQGRLLFPAIAGIGILLVAGLRACFPSRWLWRDLPAALVALFLLLSAARFPTTQIAPAYASPPRLTALPTTSRPIQITYDQRIELLGYDLAQASVAPGETLTITLYWRTTVRLQSNYSVYIHLRGPDGESLGQSDTFPARGNYATSLWQPGEIIVDRQIVPVRWGIPTPTVGRIEVGLYAWPKLENLPVRDPQGREIVPVLARFKIERPEDRVFDPQATPLARWEDGIELLYFTGQIAHTAQPVSVGVGPGETVQVNLTWRATGPVSQNRTILVHLLDNEGQIRAQNDSEPQGGRLPTSFWHPGALVTDVHRLVLPANLATGTYTLTVGLYQQPQGIRIPIQLPAADGNRFPLTTVQVSDQR